MYKFESIVISDLHLGARNTRAAELLRFLDWVDTERLIIAGDLFDSHCLARLDGEHLRVLEALRMFSRETQVVWLRGNHDPALDWFAAVLGIHAQEECLLEVGERSYLVCHGHVWDASLDMPAWIVDGADAIYRLSQWLDDSHRLARRLKHNSKTFCRAVDNVRRKGVAEARRRGLAGIVLGHSHVACDEHVAGIHYLNCGCWTERPSGFVGVRDGRAKSYFWDTIERRVGRATRRNEPAGATPAPSRLASLEMSSTTTAHEVCRHESPDEIAACACASNDLLAAAAQVH